MPLPEKSMKHEACLSRFVFVFILLLYAIYTILYTLHPGDSAAAILEFAPGILAVCLLCSTGSSLRDCYLRFAPLSRKGLTLLALSTLFMPVVLLTGRWQGWSGMRGLVYAPASGISQELFFRAALLPALMMVFRTNPRTALIVHALLFAAWHLPTAVLAAPAPAVVGIAVVTTINGILWGKQVQHDGTVMWVMIYHSLLLSVTSLFLWE